MNRYNARALRPEPDRLRDEMERIGVDDRGVAVMLPKGRGAVIKVEGLSLAAAAIVKQEFLSKGGDAAISGEIHRGAERTTDALLMGSERVYRRVCATLQQQPLESLRTLAAELCEALAALDAPRAESCQIGNLEVRWGERTLVMGIVNATPDSFSGDGLLAEAPPEALAQHAVTYALELVEQGADIIDVGGESTRPGASAVEAQRERDRVLPVIRRLRQVSDVPISIDTYKASVAEAALNAGADLVNDVWGLQMDPAMAPLVAEREVPVIIMHNRSKPRNAEQEERLGGRYVGIEYDDLMADIIRELRQQVDHALEAGIAPERIIVDPGVGFGKTVEQNLFLLNHLDELRVLGYPVLLGPSRKSFIGYTLDLPPEQRAEGTGAAVAVGILRGAADIVRVHDVRVVSRMTRMVDAILGTV